MYTKYIKLGLFTSSVLLTIITSECSRKKIVEPLFDSTALENISVEGSCGDTARIVKKVKNVTGTIQYNSYDKVYQIVTYIPGTIDSQDIGFACNLPSSLQKNGLSIQFDGYYTPINHSILIPRAGGQSFYYLRLTQVLSQTIKK